MYFIILFTVIIIVIIIKSNIINKILLIYIMPMFIENKTNGIYFAEPVADLIAVTFTVVLFAIQFKKALNNLNQLI